jgi:hypothetical protein
MVVKKRNKRLKKLWHKLDHLRGLARSEACAGCRSAYTAEADALLGKIKRVPR